MMMKHSFTLLLTLMLAACASQRVPPADPAIANEVTLQAMQQVGVPYRYGGSSPRTGFDCSGLIQFVYREGAGLRLPRTVADMAGTDAPAVDPVALQTGDLVFFDTTGLPGADHAGIYVGEGRFVHAPSRGKTVQLDRLDSGYWARCLVEGKRPLVAE